MPAAEDMGPQCAGLKCHAGMYPGPAAVVVMVNTQF